MTVVPNLLDQDRKAFPFLRGEFPSGTSITIVMASDGATRCHAVAQRPGTNEQHDPSCRTSEERYREIKRESRAVQMSPSTASLVRLTGVVMCEQDEIWQESGCFFEARKMLE